MGLTLVPSQGPSTGYLSFWNHFEIFHFFNGPWMPLGIIFSWEELGSLVIFLLLLRILVLCLKI